MHWARIILRVRTYISKKVKNNHSEISKMKINSKLSFGFFLHYPFAVLIPSLFLHKQETFVLIFPCVILESYKFRRKILKLQQIREQRKICKKLKSDGKQKYRKYLPSTINKETIVKRRHLYLMNSKNQGKKYFPMLVRLLWNLKPVTGYCSNIFRRWLCYVYQKP